MLERFALRDLDSAYQSFLKHSGLQECVILQTCNRVEIFGCGSTSDIERIKKTWASVAGLEENAFKENLEISQGIEAFEHLLKLAHRRLIVAVPYEQQITAAYGHAQLFSREKLEMWGKWSIEMLGGTARYWCEDVAGGMLVVDRSTEQE